MSTGSFHEYIIYAIYTTLGLFGLFISIRLFRGRISWGAARRMGIPLVVFGWMTLIYWLVLFEGTYGLASLLLNWPIWIDVLLFITIFCLCMMVYFKLLHREKFKPTIFTTLFLIPLSVPGVHVVRKMTPKFTPIEAVKVSKKRYPQQTLVANSGFRVEFPDPHSKGRFGDSLTARWLTDQGYREESSKIGAEGIDGVYVKYDRDVPTEILIVENKVDSGKLTTRQMTDEWVKEKVDKMVLPRSGEKVRNTGELIERNPELIVRQLWHHDLASGKTTISTLDGEARKISSKTARYLGNLTRERCESAEPTIRCIPNDQ